MQTLEQFGVLRIEAQGQRFDPNLHEAVMEVDDPSSPPGTVTRVVEPGYTLRDRLLRPARVVVAKRRSRKGSDLDDNELGSLWGAHSVDEQ
jgi:molecular chaperone GrpE